MELNLEKAPRATPAPPRIAPARLTAPRTAPPARQKKTPPPARKPPGVAKRRSSIHTAEKYEAVIGLALMLVRNVVSK